MTHRSEGQNEENNTGNKYGPQCGLPSDAHTEYDGKGIKGEQAYARCQANRIVNEEPHGNRYDTAA